jgi:cell division septation protein DedD
VPAATSAGGRFALERDAPPPARVYSRAPRVIVLMFGLLVIAFAVWWFMQNRSTTGVVEETPIAPAETLAVSTADTTRTTVDTLATRVAPPVPAPARADAKPDASVRPRRDPADTGGGTGGTMLVNSNDIQVMEDLELKYRGWFVIHISSFQTSIRAREEVAFLESREFPAFIVFLDLGPKGKWYRIYAGPFATREEARDVKKNLDAIPQVRFTRIATIPD